MSADQVAAVLYVEDDALIRVVVAMSLEDAGFKVIAAADAHQAFAALESEGKVSVCAVITDIDLGSGRPNGWEVARRARQILREISVVYVTGANGDEWRDAELHDRQAFRADRNR
jgi:CheY-like chemotaxis protein